MLLLSGAGAGAGTSRNIREALNRHIDHMYSFFVWGTFGGATVTLEISPDEPDVTPTEWFDAGVAITAKGAVNLEFRAHHVRAVVTGGAGQSINAKLI